MFPEAIYLLLFPLYWNTENRSAELPKALRVSVNSAPSFQLDSHPGLWLLREHWNHKGKQRLVSEVPSLKFGEKNTWSITEYFSFKKHEGKYQTNELVNSVYSYSLVQIEALVTLMFFSCDFSFYSFYWLNSISPLIHCSLRAYSVPGPGDTEANQTRYPLQGAHNLL